MALFATASVDDVTVQDIASSVDMTPAAVYYHYPSKDQILLRVLERFRDALLVEVGAAVAAVAEVDDLGELVTRLLTWAGSRADATVYFVTSVGLNVGVEALRRETRLLLMDELEPLGRLCAASGSGAAGVVTVGLLTQLEVSMAAMLADDVVHQELGRERFATETTALMRQLVEC